MGKARKATPAIPEERLALYDRLLATHPGIERKGASMPYTSLNGNMFTFLSATGAVGLRLPAPERERFIRKYRARLMEQHGAVLEEYVEVPVELLPKTKELSEYLGMSWAYAQTLKPKPTRKPAAKTKPRR